MMHSSAKQFQAILDIYADINPEIYLKLIGFNEELSEFHHVLWTLPFYQKIIQVSKNFNTTRYLFISDRNVSSSNLFFLYELSFSKFSFKGTHSIEKRIIDINENTEKFNECLKTVLESKEQEAIPFEIMNYTTLL